jgi:hypothetical protein
MSIESVKKAYEVFTHKDTCLVWTDEETYDVINAIAQHILNQPSCKTAELNPEQCTVIPEGYLVLKLCAEKIGHISIPTLLQHCHRFPLSKDWAVFDVINKRWYAHPQKAHDYFMSNSTTYRNRHNRIRLMKN